MQHDFRLRYRDSVRAPRVHVPNKERATVALGSQQVVGVLCKLSATGGSIRLPRRVNKGVVADLTLKTTTGEIVSAIEFLQAADNGTPPAQAFRFIHMGPTEGKQLDTVLHEMRKQGLGEKRSWKFHPVARVAVKTLNSLTGK